MGGQAGPFPTRINGPFGDIANIYRVEKRIKLFGTKFFSGSKVRLGVGNVGEWIE